MNCWAWHFIEQFLVKKTLKMDFGDPVNYRHAVGTRCYRVLILVTCLSIYAGVSAGWQVHDIYTTAVWGLVLTARTFTKLAGTHDEVFYMQFAEGKVPPKWKGEYPYNTSKAS